MKVKIKKLNEAAQMPHKSKEGDFCYDVWAISEEEVSPNVWKYGLGIAYELDRTKNYGIVFIDEDGNRNAQYCNISIDFRPRSGIYKTGMSLCNSEGTLDEFYRGEAMAIFYHIKPELPRYKVGDRIGQIKIGFTVPIEFEWADEINMDTERGINGFHSSGLK